MSIIKPMKKKDLFSDRALMLAIAISLAGHLFWLAAVKIVSSPSSGAAVKFSKIAFLGPILARVDMEVRATPAARSPLEIRYRNIIGEILTDGSSSAKSEGLKYEDRAVPSQVDRQLARVVDGAVAGEKVEPDHRIE